MTKNLYTSCAEMYNHIRDIGSSRYKQQHGLNHGHKLYNDYLRRCQQVWIYHSKDMLGPRTWQVWELA